MRQNVHRLIGGHCECVRPTRVTWADCIILVAPNTLGAFNLNCQVKVYNVTILLAILEQLVMLFIHIGITSLTIRVLYSARTHSSMLRRKKVR